MKVINAIVDVLNLIISLVVGYFCWVLMIVGETHLIQAVGLMLWLILLYGISTNIRNNTMRRILDEWLSKYGR